MFTLNFTVSELLFHFVEFVCTILTFFGAYALVQWLKEREKLRALKRKTQKLDEYQEPPNESDKNGKEVEPIAGEPEEEPITAKNKQLNVQGVEAPKPGKKDKRKKNNATSGNTKASDASQPAAEKPEKKMEEKEPQSEAVEKASEQTMDSGFHPVVRSKKAAREEARLRSKTQPIEDQGTTQAQEVTPVQVVAKPKQKPHCPPPSHAPVPQPHCPPPSHAPVMPPKSKEPQAETSQNLKADTSQNLQAVQQHLIQCLGIVKDKVVKEPEASKPPTAQLQNQLTFVDKEILKFEKKAREIEKLQEKKAAGETLESKQEEKIQRAGEIGLKLGQLYSEKLLEEQKTTVTHSKINLASVIATAPRAEPVEDSVPHSTPEAAQKKRAKKAPKSSSKPVHVPVVVPPRVKAAAVNVEVRNATEELIQHQMWAPTLEVAPAAQVEEDDDDDFEMTPLDATDGWVSEFPPQLAPQNLAPQFDLAANEWNAPSGDMTCEEVTYEHVEVGQTKFKDDCWEWVTKGSCPRGSYCRWNHRPLGNGVAEQSVFALNCNIDSDDDSDW